MVKKEKADARLLSKLLPGTQISGDGTPPYTLTFDGQGNWEVGEVTIDGAQYYVAVSNGYWDLSGYSLQDKTLFATGMMLQTTPNTFGVFDGFISRIVSTEPLNLDDFQVTSPSRNWALPGSSGSSYSMQQIFYGDCTLYATDTTVNSLVPVSSSTWGTGSSTAREKLYCAVAICWVKTGNLQLFMPDTNFVMPIVIDKEAELEYMMRLQRSIEPV